ncbi:MAG TPA: hypothetical protein VEH49_03730 [Methylomirabilota bacterium]|nr:hypothetical protein [Methylomirabilota bacterium]
MPTPLSMFDTPRPVSSLPASDYIQPKFGDGLRIWWAFWWRTALVTAVLSVITAMAVRRLYERFMIQANVAGPILNYNAFFFSYLTAFFVMMYLLRKNFRNFRIGLLSNHGDEGAEVLPPTLRRTARVWWTYSWRSLVYRLILGFVASFPVGMLTGFLLSAFNAGPAFAQFIRGLVAVAVDAGAGMFVIYTHILDEDISDFHVALLPRGPSSELAAAPAVPAGG